MSLGKGQKGCQNHKTNISHSCRQTFLNIFREKDMVGEKADRKSESKREIEEV